MFAVVDYAAAVAVDAGRGISRIIEASAEVSGAAPDGEHAVSHRVIADHLRSTSFLIAEGVLPSNSGQFAIGVSYADSAICILHVDRLPDGPYTGRFESSVSPGCPR